MIVAFKLPRGMNLRIRRSTNLLDSNSKRKVNFIICVQILLGFLDLIGVVLIGAIGALSVQGVESHKPGNKVSHVLLFLHLNSLKFQTQIAVLGIVAALIFILKTAMSILFTKKIYFFLSHKSADLSSRLTSAILSQDLLSIQRNSTQDLLYIISNGVNFILLGVIAGLISLISDFAMLLILFTGLLFVDPILAISTLSLFSTVGFFLYRFLHTRSKELGLLNSVLIVKNNTKILEVLNTYRETLVRNRRDYYRREISKLRHELADVTAEASFQPFIGKYVIETSSVIGAFCLASYEFAVNNAVHAVAIMGLFLAASSRIAPAALRIQQGFLGIKNSSGAADSSLDLIEELGLNQDSSKDLESKAPDFTYEDFVPQIKIKNVRFSYPGNAHFAIDDVDLSIPSGTVTAIVGPSGAGKSTLIDLLLGVLEPNEGSILMSGIPVKEALVRWSGAVSYVPQNIEIIGGTFRENVALGYPPNLARDELVWSALEIAQLIDVVKTHPEALDLDLGERGAKISGGQRQRLGIARALFTAPKLLVLDEATSALDSQVERDISDAIRKLSGRTTVIIVAHRLSTVRNADQVIYLDNGLVKGVGSFENLRSLIPDFDEQAKLMGI